MLLFGRLLIPGKGAALVAFHADSVSIMIGECALRFGQALLGGGADPVQGQCRIGRHASVIRIIAAERPLRLGHAVGRRPLQ